MFMPHFVHIFRILGKMYADNLLDSGKNKNFVDFKMIRFLCLYTFGTFGIKKVFHNKLILVGTKEVIFRFL